MDVQDIVSRLKDNETISNQEIAHLLSSEGREQEIIFEAAREIRNKMFGKEIYLYGFMYFSTYCRNDCSFCYFRKSNDISRYRKTREEILETSHDIYDSGINLIDLTMGEDPMMIKNDYQAFIDIVSDIRDDMDIPIMASPGAVPKEMMSRFSESGVDIVACYQETYNRDLFAERRLNQDFDYRYNQKIWAMEAGMLAEDGMMIGIGETIDDRADTISKMVSSGCDQIRAMTFVPQTGTPMEMDKATDSTGELLAMAVMRLMHHDALIPATLDVEGISGMKKRLNAGASVITSIIPPNKNLAGVAQSSMDIEEGHRCVDYVIGQLESLDLKPSTPKGCRKMMDSRKNRLN